MTFVSASNSSTSSSSSSAAQAPQNSQAQGKELLEKELSQYVETFKKRNKVNEVYCRRHQTLILTCAKAPAVERS